MHPLRAAQELPSSQPGILLHLCPSRSRAVGRPSRDWSSEIVLRVFSGANRLERPLPREERTARCAQADERWDAKGGEEVPARAATVLLQGMRRGRHVRPRPGSAGTARWRAVGALRSAPTAGSAGGARRGAAARPCASTLRTSTGARPAKAPALTQRRSSPSPASGACSPYGIIAIAITSPNGALVRGLYLVHARVAVETPEVLSSRGLFN